MKNTKSRLFTFVQTVTMTWSLLPISNKNSQSETGGVVDELSIISRELSGHPRPRADLLPWASGAETMVEYNCVNDITTGTCIRKANGSDAELAAFLLDR